MRPRHWWKGCLSCEAGGFTDVPKVQYRSNTSVTISGGKLRGPDRNDSWKEAAAFSVSTVYWSAENNRKLKHFFFLRKFTSCKRQYGILLCKIFFQYLKSMMILMSSDSSWVHDESEHGMSEEDIPCSCLKLKEDGEVHQTSSKTEDPIQTKKRQIWSILFINHRKT